MSHNGVMDFLPQNKYQLIGFAIFTLAQLISEFFLGERARQGKNLSGSILGLIFRGVGSTIISVTTLILSRGRKNESGSTQSSDKTPS